MRTLSSEKYVDCSTISGILIESLLPWRKLNYISALNWSCNKFGMESNVLLKYLSAWLKTRHGNPIPDCVATYKLSPKISACQSKWIRQTEKFTDHYSPLFQFCQQAYSDGWMLHFSQENKPIYLCHSASEFVFEFSDWSTCQVRPVQYAMEDLVSLLFFIAFNVIQN